MRSATSACKTISYEDVAGKGAKQIAFEQVPVERADRVRRRGAPT